jgi:hypothetical protein
MALSSGLLETLFQDLVSEDRFEEGVDHLGNDPDAGDVLEAIHADADALLGLLLHGRYR